MKRTNLNENKLWQQEKHRQKKKENSKRRGRTMTQNLLHSESYKSRLTRTQRKGRNFPRIESKNLIVRVDKSLGSPRKNIRIASQSSNNSDPHCSTDFPPTHHRKPTQNPVSLSLWTETKPNNKTKRKQERIPNRTQAKRYSNEKEENQYRKETSPVNRSETHTHTHTRSTKKIPCSPPPHQWNDEYRFMIRTQCVSARPIFLCKNRDIFVEFWTRVWWWIHKAQPFHTSSPLTKSRHETKLLSFLPPPNQKEQKKWAPFMEGMQGTMKIYPSQRSQWNRKDTNENRTTPTSET